MRYYQTYFRKLTFLEWLLYFSSSKTKQDFKNEDERIRNLIENNYKIFEQMGREEVSRDYRSSADVAKTYNNTCSRCNSVGKAVDKISQVKGSGNISGDFIFGIGSISGGSSIDTNAVNHCNACGHEWVKKEATFGRTKDKCKSLLWAVEGYFLKNHDYRKGIVDEIKNKGVSAEALYHAIHEEKCLGDYDSAFEALTLEVLRKHFVSIL